MEKTRLCVNRVFFHIDMTAKKKQAYRPKPISEENLQELENKYGVPKEELRKMAKEMKCGKPKLEMHLIYLSVEAKKKQG